MAINSGIINTDQLSHNNGGNMLFWFGILLVMVAVGLIVSVVLKSMRSSSPPVVPSVPSPAPSAPTGTPTPSTARMLSGVLDGGITSLFKKVKFPTSATTIALAILGFAIPVLIFAIGKFVFSLLFSGADPSPASSEPKITSSAPWWIPVTHWHFMIILGVSGLGILAWKKWGKGEKWPPKEVLTVVLGLPAVHWLAWVTFKNHWVDWLTSGYFFPMHVALVLTAWLAGKKSKGTLYNITRALIAVLVVMLATKQFSGKDFRNVWKGWWTSNTEVIAMPVNGMLSEGDGVKLPSAPWLYYTGPERDQVMEAFPGDTTMWNIAACESQFRQFNDDGTVLSNPSSSARGVFQILEGTHGKDAKSQGLDILTTEGNIAYAKVLRARNGYKDWEASKASSDCWRDYVIASSSTEAVSASPSVAPPTAKKVAGSVLPAMDVARVYEEKLITIYPDGEWSEKLNPGRFAIMWDLIDPAQSVYLQAHEIGAPGERVHEMVYRARTSPNLGIQINWIRFRALNPSDTVRIQVRWFYK